MNNNRIKRILLTALIALTACSAQAAIEEDLIAILKSQASVVDKCNACEQLRIHGTAKSVPALALLLTDQRMGHAARYALEAMPYPQVGVVLRNALGKMENRIRLIGCNTGPPQIVALPILEFTDVSDHVPVKNPF